MRYLDLSKFKGVVIPTASSEVGKVLLRNRYSSHWPHPQVSLRTFAVMVWPNDDMRRNRFLDAFTASYGKIEQPRPGGLGSDGDLPVAGRSIQIRNLGTEVLDHLDPEIKSAQEGWRNTGDLLLTLTRLDANPHPVIRGGASISKAKDVIEAARSGANRSRLELDWSKYRDVGHLVAASCYITALGIQQTGDVRSINLVTPIFADPGTLLCLARTFQNFGLAKIAKGGTKPVLPGSTWRIPTSDQFPAAAFSPGPLNSDEIEVLRSRQARRDAHTK